MKLIDLSQEIFHRDRYGQHWAHPMPLIFPYITHEQAYAELNGITSYTTEWLNLGSHIGTHMDAQKHNNPGPDAMTADQIPLDWCYGDAVCLDLTNKPPKSWITIRDLKEAAEGSNLEIRKGDILLLHTGTWNRTRGTPAYQTDNPGLNREAARWIYDSGVKLFGVDAVTPDNPIDQAQNMIYPTHDLLRDTGLPIIENLANLDKVVNRRFTFIGFPIKIKGASGAWVRAVAMINE